MRVALVVDDDGQVRRAVRRLLEAHGWVVVDVADVAAARKVLVQGVVVDAIVADWNMPGDRNDRRPPGRQVLALAAAGQPPAYRSIPVLLLTGRTDLSDEDVTGFSWVVPKLDASTVPILLRDLPSLSEPEGGNGAVH